MDIEISPMEDAARDDQSTGVFPNKTGNSFSQAQNDDYEHCDVW